MELSERIVFCFYMIMVTVFHYTKKPGSLRIPDIYEENKHWKVSLRLQCNHFFQRLLVLSSEQKVSEYRIRILHEYLLR